MSNPPISTPKPTAALQNGPLIVALLVVDSMHYIFARLLLPHLPATTSSFYTLLVGTVETAVFLALRRQIKWQVLRDHLWFFLIVGFLVAAATAISFAAVAYIDPGSAALIAQTYTIFSLGLGLFWLRERLRPLQWIGAALAVVGVFVISFQPGSAADLLRLGAVLVLVSNLFYALHTAVVKRYGDDMDFGNFFLFRVASTGLFLLLFALGRGEMSWPDTSLWLLLLLVGTVNITLGRILYYLALRRLKMSIHTILLTLSPALTILWSLALFGERPSLQGFIGGAVIVSGVLLVTLNQSRKQF
ncbi:MAG: DMT family transporter [Ardenticatenaceae bacterium]|nr:DMT family transporter [Ardenticatenaceae bacterium]MCB9445983.1 DMT family transporter [Ardenticatenaceae bacterium]